MEHLKITQADLEEHKTEGEAKVMLHLFGLDQSILSSLPKTEKNNFTKMLRRVSNFSEAKAWLQLLEAYQKRLHSATTLS